MKQYFPDYIKPYNDRAQKFEKEGKYDEAIVVYREALARYPNIAGLHNNLGCCLANKEDYKQAENEFHQAIALTPVNRQEGIIISDSYPAEPIQNLRAAQARNKGFLRAPLPARTEFEGRSLLRPDPFRPGMGFPPYVFWFLLSPVGWFLVFVATLVTGVLWYDRSPYCPIAFGVSCFIILLVAFIAYITDPRLRSQ